MAAKTYRSAGYDTDLSDAEWGLLKPLIYPSEHSAPIMAAIKARLEQLRPSHRHRPTRLTGEALSYALNQWPKLRVLLGDGRVQIDNNLVENTIRPSAIGKKNCLRLRSQAAPS